MHSNIFPTTRQMEAEVVCMTAAMLHGGPGTPAPGEHVIVGVQGNHLRVAPSAPH